MDPRLRVHARYAEKTSKKLARAVFHAMLRHGPKLEREQMLLGRLMDVGTELFAITATCSRAQHLLEHGEDRHEILALVDFFCKQSCLRIRHSFRGVRNNNDHRGYRLARRILDGGYAWLEEGIVRGK